MISFVHIILMKSAIINIYVKIINTVIVYIFYVYSTNIITNRYTLYITYIY